MQFYKKTSAFETWLDTVLGNISFFKLIAVKFAISEGNTVTCLQDSKRSGKVLSRYKLRLKL